MWCQFHQMNECDNFIQQIRELFTPAGWDLYKNQLFRVLRVNEKNNQWLFKNMEIQQAWNEGESTSQDTVQYHCCSRDQNAFNKAVSGHLLCHYSLYST